MSMEIRRATIEDAKTLFSWRNDPDTRANSVSIKPVTWPEHIAWLERVLKDPNRELMIAEVDGIPVGTNRGDKGEGGIEINTTIGPEFRGRGFGKMMLQKYVAMLSGVLLKRIKKENIASVKITEAAGFSMTHEADGMVFFKKTVPPK